MRSPALAATASSFAEVPIERATAYAAEDADVTFRLWDALHPRMRPAKALTLYENRWNAG